MAANNNYGSDFYNNDMEANGFGDSYQMSASSRWTQQYKILNEQMLTYRNKTQELQQVCSGGANNGGNLDYALRKTKEVKRQMDRVFDEFKRLQNITNELQPQDGGEREDKQKRLDNLCRDFKREAAATKQTIDRVMQQQQSRLDQSQQRLSDQVNYDASGHGDISMTQQQQQMTQEDPNVTRQLQELHEMRSLQNDIEQLNTLFGDLNTKIHEQADMVDAIEENTAEAGHKMEEAQTQLTKAVDYKRAACKKKICIIGIVLAILAVLALIITLSVVYKS